MSAFLQPPVRFRRMNRICLKALEITPLGIAKCHPCLRTPVNHVPSLYTSNAVERGNRRYRKMQASIYRVRTQARIEGRLALDLLRDPQAQDRAETTRTLHRARAA
jgi:hypothetical protein